MKPIDPKLTILIGTYNRLDKLMLCLISLMGKISYNHKIVVIDAGSTDGTIEYLKQLDRIHTVCEGKRIGQAVSLNRALDKTSSNYVCWLSDDNVAREGMIDQSILILERQPKIGMVALKVKDIMGKQAGEPYIGSIWPSGVLNCNQGMIRTELLKGLGGFSKDFMDYGMDSDLTTKVLLSGYKVVYTKRIAIDHYRDHETNSWINAEKRKERMKVAIELYKRRYEKIIFSQTGRNYDKYSQLYSKKIRFVTSLYHWADRIGVSLEKRLGYNVRDWRNIFAGRFISKWDLIKNRQKPYYLVQHIPKRNRSCVITF